MGGTQLALSAGGETRRAREGEGRGGGSESDEEDEEEEGESIGATGLYS